MAKKKHRKLPKKARSHKKRKHGGRARSRSGFGLMRSSGPQYSLDTLPKILLSAAILRFGSGVVYWWFRKQFATPGADPKALAENFKKAKIIFPALVAVASAKKWIPNLPGLTPMAIGLAFYSIVENFDSLRDLFDLKSLDSKPAGGREVTLPVSGMSARTWAETRNQLAAMSPRNGLMLTNQPNRFNGISVQNAPRGFSGRDPRAMKRVSN